MDKLEKNKIDLLRERFIRNPLLTAYVLSMLIHCIGFGIWKSGMLKWPDRIMSGIRSALSIQPPPRLQVQKVEPPRKKEDPANSPTKEIPLTFIEVEPEQAATKAPENAKFYSTANTVAANPNPKKDEAMPEVSGQQKVQAKLRETPRSALPQPPPEQSTPPPVPPANRAADLAQRTLTPAAEEQTPPKREPDTNLQPAPEKTQDDNALEPLPPQTPKVVKLPTTTATPSKGSAALLPPSNTTAPEVPPKPVRPRSIASAKQAAGIPGPQMQSNSGVQRRGQISVDAKQSPFGEYDRAFINAIQSHWYNLIDNSKAVMRTGKVVLEFNLTYDGRITDMKVRENEVGEVPSLMCQRAVMEPARYPQWPREMQQMLGGNVRVVKLTFYYY